MQIKSLQYFGVQTFVELLCHHKRQIPGVGRNVYVWQLNAVLPTTGLILHPWGDGRFSGAKKGKRSKWQEPGSMFMTPSRRTFSWCPMMMLRPPHLQVQSQTSRMHRMCFHVQLNQTKVPQYFTKSEENMLGICGSSAQIWGQPFLAQKIWVNTFRSKTRGQTKIFQFTKILEAQF